MVNVLLIIFISIFNLFSIRTTANRCTSRDFNSVTSSIIPPSHVFDVLRPGGLVLCARECIYRSRCNSFNYIETSGDCQLIDDIFPGSGQNNTGAVHSDITLWPKEIAERCKDRVCSNEETCVPSMHIQCQQTYHYVVQANNTALLGYTFDRFNVSKLQDCISTCHTRSACKSFNYNPSLSLCELNTVTMLTGYQSYVNNQPGTFYSNIDQYDYNSPPECGGGCNNYSVCVSGTGCVVQYCPQPTYSDNHIIQAFDQSVTLWAIGSNLNYGCVVSYLPSTDWLCLTNGTWQNGSCKGVRSCPQLFNDCNSTYGNGTYIFKFPGTDDDVIVMCTLAQPTRNYLRVLTNSTYSRLSSICNSYNCGLTTYEYVRILVSSTKILLYIDKTFTTINPSYCDRQHILQTFEPCEQSCRNGEPSEFSVDLRGTGLAHTSYSLNKVIVEYLSNNQILKGGCENCNETCLISSTKFLVPAPNTSINYTGAVSPACKFRI